MVDRMVKRDVVGGGGINMFKIHGIKFHVLMIKNKQNINKHSKHLNLKTAIKMDNLEFRLLMLLYFYISCMFHYYCF